MDICGGDAVLGLQLLGCVVCEFCGLWLAKCWFVCVCYPNCVVLGLEVFAWDFGLLWGWYNIGLGVGLGFVIWRLTGDFGSVVGCAGDWFPGDRVGLWLVVGLVV